MILGITGGSGCGKTTALQAIEELGGVVLDCDRIYHELLARDEALLAAIGARFPGTCQDGTLDRKALAAIVFSDSAALEDLNRLTHGAVRQEVCRRLEAAPQLAAIDAIALFESGLADLCQVTVAVTAPEEQRLQRLMRRDHITRQQALDRIRAQKSPGWFREKCDHVLENTGSVEEFREKCLEFFRTFHIMKAST